MTKDIITQHVERLKKEFPQYHLDSSFNIETLVHKIVIAKEHKGLLFGVERWIKSEEGASCLDLEGDFYRYHALLDNLDKTSCLFKVTHTLISCDGKTEDCGELGYCRFVIRG